MERFPLVYGCLLGALLMVVFATYAEMWPLGVVGTLVDRCDDENAAVSFVCRDTWMARLRTNFR